MVTISIQCNDDYSMQRILFRFIINLSAISFILISCHRQEFNRFPLAEKYNIDGEKLTLAFDEFIKVEGALSIIVSRNGQIVAEEYTNFNNYGADSIKNIMSVTKTITGVLVGLAIDKGYIESVNDPISKYLTGVVTFPDNTKISTNDDIPYGPVYGYQIWLGSLSDYKYFMAMGWGGQFIVIVPDLQLVVAATCWTGGISDRQAGEHWMSIIKIIMEKVIPSVN